MNLQSECKTRYCISLKSCQAELVEAGMITLGNPPSKSSYLYFIN
jgi:hypothetical protein